MMLFLTQGPSDLKVKLSCFTASQGNLLQSLTVLAICNSSLMFSTNFLCYSFSCIELKSPSIQLVPTASHHLLAFQKEQFVTPKAEFYPLKTPTNTAVSCLNIITPIFSLLLSRSDLLSLHFFPLFSCVST